jgi:CheY-like chemotaxis protein
MPDITILVVDDVDDARELITFIFQDAGYRVIGARNGREAVELVLADPPDLILMDIFMPEFDGIEATQEIKTNPRFSHIPVIAFTAKGPLPNSSAGLFVTTLTKPCSPPVLLDTVNKWTEGTRRP